MNWHGGNQFGGNKMDASFASPGGFMANTSFSSPSMSQGREKSRKNLSMVPVTVALINNAAFDSDAEVCELDGVKLHQVTFIGIVSSINENMTHLAYEIDDFTGGCITVKRWIDKQENPEEYQQSMFREDTYVRIYGYIKVLDDGTKTVVAFNMNRVTDFNEITYHLLSVIHAKLALLKAEAIEDSGGGNQFGNNTFSGQGEFGQGIDGSGMSKTQFRVLEIISSTTSTEGMGMNEIRQKLRGMSEANIREAVEFLSNEGHIYSTIDDDHFRSTNA